MPYYYKNGKNEAGPFEERIIIARLIDGEINSRSQIRSSLNDESLTLGETEFGAVLDKLTQRWKYNMAALNREVGFLYSSLVLLLLLPLLTVFGYARGWTWIRENISLVFFSGQIIWLMILASVLYFYWMVGYRLWRIVPKSMYSVTPGWRILLTFVPFFRLGWDFCMWVRLADRLRKLTNYTRRAGRAMAICYSTGMILSTLGFWSMLFLPYLPFVSNPASHPESVVVLGTYFWISELFIIVLTMFFFVRMIAKMRKTAIAILRRRYAYNVPTEEIKSQFMNNVLIAQRRRDRRRRWGHGLGIIGVLFGGPMLVVGLPMLILLIVGSCRYGNGLDNLDSAGYAASEREFYNLFYPARPPETLNEIIPIDADGNYPALSAFGSRLRRTNQWAKEQLKNLPDQPEALEALYFDAQRREKAISSDYRRIIHAELLKMDIFRKNLSFADQIKIWGVGSDDLRLAYFGYSYFRSPFANLAMRRHINRAMEILENVEKDFYEHPGEDTPNSNKLWAAARFITIGNCNRTINLNIAQVKLSLRQLQKQAYTKLDKLAPNTMLPIPSMVDPITGDTL